MENLVEKIQKDLFSMQDPGYRDFHSRLMPTVEKERIIGVRTPALRKYAAAFSKTPDAAVYLKILPHTYYEENNLHAFLIEKIRTFDDAIAALDAFLPYVDNWATCDMMSPKIFAKHIPELLPHARRWMASEHSYTVRYGIGMLMRYFLGEHFSPDYPAEVAAIRSDEYYINMMIAWYFATALAMQYDLILPYITERRLPQWVHEKTIQKAVESYRLTDAQKAELKQYR